MGIELPGMRRFDQWLLDTSINTPVSGLANRGRYLLLRAIRHFRVSLSDPLVNFSLGNTNLRLRLSHELPFHCRSFPEYSQNLGKVSFQVRKKYPNLTMIDVGANVGDSVAIVRRYSNHPILCVEGEPGFFRLLKQNTGTLPHIDLEQTFLGLEGDYVGGISAERGNARVLLGSTPGETEISTLSNVLSRHPRFATAKLIKLDAEGFDCRIISEETQLLRRNKPVLFFEYYPTSCKLTGQEAFPVFSKLSSLGYAVILIYQNFGRYFMTLSLDQFKALEDLHHFIADLGGFCDVVAFHEEDLDIASHVRASEYAARDNGKSHPAMARAHDESR